MVIPKYGLGYNLDVADNRNKKDKIILNVQGSVVLIFAMTIFLSNINNCSIPFFLLTLS
jgi:hypothetical protein